MSEKHETLEPGSEEGKQTPSLEEMQKRLAELEQTNETLTTNQAKLETDLQAEQTKAARMEKRATSAQQRMERVLKSNQGQSHQQQVIEQVRSPRQPLPPRRQTPQPEATQEPIPDEQPDSNMEVYWLRQLGAANLTEQDMDAAGYAIEDFESPNDIQVAITQVSMQKRLDAQDEELSALKSQDDETPPPGPGQEPPPAGPVNVIDSGGPTIQEVDESRKAVDAQYAIARKAAQERPGEKSAALAITAMHADPNKVIIVNEDAATNTRLGQVPE